MIRHQAPGQNIRIWCNVLLNLLLKKNVTIPVKKDNSPVSSPVKKVIYKSFPELHDRNLLPSLQVIPEVGKRGRQFPVSGNGGPLGDAFRIIPEK